MLQDLWATALNVEEILKQLHMLALFGTRSDSTITCDIEIRQKMQLCCYHSPCWLPVSFMLTSTILGVYSVRHGRTSEWLAENGAAVSPWTSLRGMAILCSCAGTWQSMGCLRWLCRLNRCTALVTICRASDPVWRTPKPICRAWEHQIRPVIY